MTIITDSTERSVTAAQGESSDRTCKGRQCELSVKKGGNTKLGSSSFWEGTFFYACARSKTVTERGRKCNYSLFMCARVRRTGGENHDSI